MVQRYFNRRERMKKPSAKSREHGAGLVQQGLGRRKVLGSHQRSTTGLGKKDLTLSS